MRPQDALAAARAAAAAAAQADGEPAPPELVLGATDAVTLERLLEWATIEPDPSKVYSTRRLGLPITLVKKGLARALRQQTAQMAGAQARFNVQLVLYVSQLADRVERLEEQAALRPPGGDAAP